MSHGFLHRMDLVLRDKAIGGFADVAGATGARLFFNLDNRVIRSPDDQPNRTVAIAAKRSREHLAVHRQT